MQRLGAPRVCTGPFACGVALLVGALAAQALPVLPPRWFDLAVLLVTPALLAFCLTRRTHAGIVLLALAVAAFGWTTWCADRAMSARLPHALEGADLVVRGMVRDLPEAQAESTRFEFDADQAELNDAAVSLRGTLRLSWYATHDAQPPMLTPCSHWQLHVRLKRPRGLLDPGGFDFERYALQQGIVATGYVREDTGNRALGAPMFCVDALRDRIAAALSASLPADPHAANLLRALSVGDQRALDEADWQVLRATGTGHLIAISGFHVGLAAVFGVWLIRMFWFVWPPLALRMPRPVAEASIALPAAFAYGALAGFGLPTTRTLLMIAAVSLARIVRRNGGMGEGFGLALCAILIADPLSVLAAGFWLSFVGVAFLAYTLDRGAGWRGRLREIGLAPLLMALALLPLTVWFFGQASLAGPIANLIAVPLVSFVLVPVTLLASLSLMPLPAFGVPLLHVAAWLADAYWAMLTWIASWPPALYYPPESGIAAFALACLGVIVMLAPRGMPARWLGVALLLPLLWPRIDLPRDGGFAATVIDVGQGLSVLVRTRGHALLFDTGARFPSGFDLGEAAVVPSLHALGVERLDMLIVSHGDNDHSGGARSVLAAFPAAQALGGEPARGPVPLAQCHAGQSWNWNGVAFRVLHPPLPIALHGNDAGCVLHVEGRGGRLLLPADTTTRVEPQIVSEMDDGPPLVLIAPHHGSKTSSSEDYLLALHPVLAIASAGYRNRFHHPAPVIIERYRTLGIPLLDSADTGAVRIAFPPDAPPRVESEERLRQTRYWREH